MSDESPFAAEMARRANTSAPVASGESPFSVELGRRQAARPEKPAKDSPAMDILKSLGTGVARGAGELVFAPVTVAHAAAHAIESAGEGAAHLFGIKASPEFKAKQERATREAGFGIGDVRGPVDAARGVISGAIDANLHAPQTMAGRYAETIGEFAPAAFVGNVPGFVEKGLAARVASGAAPAVADAAALAAVKAGAGRAAGAVVPAVSSETAGQLTQGSAAEPYARFLGAAVPGLAGALGRAIHDAPARAVSSATERMTPAEYEAAAALHSKARALGVPITGPEAIQGATSGATQLGELQRLAEGSLRGGATMAQFFRERPGQVDAAMQRVLDAITRPTSRPSDIAPAINQVGIDAMQAAERMRTRAVNPYYNAARTETLNPNAVRAVANEFERAGAGDTTGILSGPLERARGLFVRTPATEAAPEVLATDIGNLNRARKHLRDQSELPAFAADAIPKETSAVLGNVLGGLRDRMERGSRNFAQGNQEYERLSRTVIDPFAASPTGQLAKAATPEAQASIMFSRNPKPGSQKQVGNAAKSIAARRPDVVGDFIRNQIERQYNASSADLGRGANQYAGAKFAKDLVGNEQQRKNLTAVLDALPNGGYVQRELGDLLDVFQATGTRIPAGFISDLRNTTNTEFGTNHALHAVGAGGVHPAGAALSALREVVTRGTRTRNAGRLADVFVAPDSVQQIQRFGGRTFGAPFGDFVTQFGARTGGFERERRTPAPARR